MDSRAVTPVVEKTITIGLVSLFLAGMTATLFGGAVPSARDSVGASLGDRTLAIATERVEQAVPPNASAVTVEHRVDLPSTIRGANYEIRTDGRALVLDHPRASVGGRSRLVLPPQVTSVSGSWESGEATIVVVRSVRDGLAIELREGRP
jgi:FlaG/FlaF family flagellin (archaellin)